MNSGLGVRPQACSIRAHNSRSARNFASVRNWSASAAEPRIDHALRIFERNAGLLDRAQIGDAGGQHERQFLHFRSAGIMDHPSIGDRERALEAHRGEALDRAGDRGHDLVPAIGTGAPHRAGAERIEPEADVAGGGIDALCA